MITAARLLYVQKLEDSEITHNRGMAGEDDRTSRDGKTNLFDNIQYIFIYQ